MKSETIYRLHKNHKSSRKPIKLQELVPVQKKLCWLYIGAPKRKPGKRPPFVTLGDLATDLWEWLLDWLYAHS